LVNDDEMIRKYAVSFSVLVILAFIGYIIFDSIRPDSSDKIDNNSGDVNFKQDSWKLSTEFSVMEGKLKAVTVSPSGDIYLGGDSFVSCYDKELKLRWNIKTPGPVSALSFYGDTIYASSIEQVFLINASGEIKNEWGPFEEGSIFTSLSANRSFVAVSDAGNKMILILDKGGEVKKLIGQNDGQFIIPSPYFDVALSDDNNLFIANTGHRRIEKRNIDGEMKNSFGEPGIAPEAFCGCCNPAHFILIPDGFVTAEKGINRIKILNDKGDFVEFVSSRNEFVASVPLDLASSDGKIIYAANPADSKLYIFTRK
jgi:hypothetical protein